MDATAHQRARQSDQATDELKYGAMPARWWSGSKSGAEAYCTLWNSVDLGRERTWGFGSGDAWTAPAAARSKRSVDEGVSILERKGNKKEEDGGWEEFRSEPREACFSMDISAKSSEGRGRGKKE